MLNLLSKKHFVVEEVANVTNAITIKRTRALFIVHYQHNLLLYYIKRKSTHRDNRMERNKEQ